MRHSFGFVAKLMTVLMVFFLGAFALEMYTAPPEEQLSLRTLIKGRLDNLLLKIIPTAPVASLLQQGTPLVEPYFTMSEKALRALIPRVIHYHEELPKQIGSVELWASESLQSGPMLRQGQELMATWHQAIRPSLERFDNLESEPQLFEQLKTLAAQSWKALQWVENAGKQVDEWTK